MNDDLDRHVAAPLANTIGPENLNHVAAWLRDVASEHALETTDGKVHSPSVAWLAEAVTYYEPQATP
jgi:hypothetical protein